MWLIARWGDEVLYGLALCSGMGGLEAGLHLALPEYRTVCAVERQAYSAACLVSWMEGAGMVPPPVWDDIATFDPLPWRECVDIVSAGYPCQPFSYAGKGLGEHDERHLWPHVRRIVRAIMPPVVFCENVAAHLTRGFDTVKRDLERLGYTVAAGIHSAAEVGAPHLRERLFILGVLADARGMPGSTGAERTGREKRANLDRRSAWTDVADAPSHGRAERRAEHARLEGRSDAAVGGSGLGHSHGGVRDGRPGVGGRGPEEGIVAGRTGEELGHAEGQGLAVGKGKGRGEEGQPGFECTGFCGGEEYWPWPAGRGAEQHQWEGSRLVESGLGRAVNGVGARNEQLLGLGNGVVPVAAAMAFVSLWGEVMNGN